MIKIEKISEVYIRVYSDEGTEMEISNFFTFDVPGAKFSPKFKARLWDGKISLYSVHKKTLYLGLLNYLIKFAQDSNHEIEYISNSFYETPLIKSSLLLSEVEDWIKSLNISKDNQPIELRDYQIASIFNAISEKRITIISPTGSGKSAIIYCIIRWLLEKDIKILLIVPTTSLVTQMYNDFAEYSELNNWKVEEHCQMLYSGMDKDIKASVLISTWQSTFKYDNKQLSRYKCIIGDEAQEYAAKSVSGMLEKMTMTPYRIGTTGTIPNDKSKVNRLTIEGLFGRVYNAVSTKDLMDNGSLSQLQIYPILLKYSTNYKKNLKKVYKKLEYKDEMDLIVLNPNRNKIISSLTRKCSGTALVLFQFVEKHGIPLYELIKSEAGDRPVYIIHGGISVEEREKIRNNLKTDKDAILIASYQTYSRGINAPSIQNIILASPTKSEIRILQSIGRGLRLLEGKNKCNLFDIGDELSLGTIKNHTLRHFIDRIKLYISQNFNYKMIPINIKD